MKTNLKSWLEEYGEKLLKQIGIEKGQNILDFGCGSGSYTIPAAKIVGSKGRIYALDKDKKVLNNLMKRAETFGLRNVKEIKTSGELKLNLEDETCDVVLLFDVFHDHYFPRKYERRKLLQQLYRILKPNGFLAVYPKHKEMDTRDEVESANFYLESCHFGKLLHDDVDLEEGQVLRFRKESI